MALDRNAREVVGSMLLEAGRRLSSSESRQHRVQLEQFPSLPTAADFAFELDRVIPAVSLFGSWDFQGRLGLILSLLQEDEAGRRALRSHGTI